MQLIKPAWLAHSGEQKDFEVYSCHVSPDGKRLATAGGDGHVRIWSTEAIYNSNDSTYKKPRQLCHMSHHLGTIHAVRFSPNGRYLASGADDKLICIYHLDASPPSYTASFGTNEPPPVENWKTSKRLVGHDNDVQDLAWSPDSSLLVSVGLDSKIVVWSGHSFEKLKTLPSHQSQVKGITFDPANKFFATASDDRTVKIWRYTPPGPNATQHDMVNNFILETTITAPFKGSPMTTYFRRCSWSPDGHHIAASNAVNGPVSSISIIERATWDSDISLIGHEGPTEVCAFSPRLFHTRDPSLSNGQGTTNGQAKTNLVTVIASAGQDKILTVWNTNTSRPVVICQDIATKSVVDIAWAPDGQTLFACSLDGSVVMVRFAGTDLGWVAEEDETDKALQVYGTGRKGMGVAEDVDGLTLENQSKEGELRGVQSRMGALMGDLPSANKEIPPPAATNGTTKSPRDDAADALAEQPDKSQEADKIPAQDATAKRIEELKSRVTIGKDGRKRVAPLLVSSPGTGQSSLPQTQLLGTTSRNGNMRDDAPQTILDMSKPYDGLPKGGLATLLLGDKRKAVALEADAEDVEPAPKRLATGPLPILVNGVNGVEPANLESAVRGQTTVPNFLRPALMHPSIAISNVRLGVPKVRSHIVRSMEGGVLLDESATDEVPKMPDNVVLEAINPVQAKDPSHVTVTKRGAVLWQDFLPKAVLLVTGNKDFWAAACEDGSIYLWSPAGRRLTPPMLLESQPVIFENRNEWLLCISAAGLAHVWNVKTMASPHPPVSLGPILDVAVHSLNQHTATPGPSVTSAHLNATGHVIVTLNNGDGYYYARDMYTWQRLSESWWAVGSQYWNSNDSSISALQSTAVGPATNLNGHGINGVATQGKVEVSLVSAGIIPYLERHTTNEFLLKGRAYTLQRLIKALLSSDGFEGFESSVSIAHLENRMAGALQLGARDEFRLYLLMYAKRIGAEGLRGKVEELLNVLLGGVLQDTKTNGTPRDQQVKKGWFSEGLEIGGWDRRELLKGVVMILGKYRDLQRLTVQYARVLGLTDIASDDIDEEMTNGDHPIEAEPQKLVANQGMDGPNP